MTQTWDCAEARPSLGVYVLGAIDPGERGLVDAHLVTCRDCRDELAGLAGLPALLARVNPDEISRIRADDTVRPASSDDPPEELLGTVLGLAEARRRRNRWRYLSAAAAVAAIAGGLFAGLSSATSTTITKTVAVGFPNGAATWDTANATNAATGVTATVAYADQLWGDSFQVLVDHIPAGTTCQLTVVHMWVPPRRHPDRGRGLDDRPRRGQGLVRRLDAEHRGVDRHVPDHRGKPGPAHGQADLNP